VTARQSIQDAISRAVSGGWHRPWSLVVERVSEATGASKDEVAGEMTIAAATGRIEAAHGWVWKGAKG
jgi:hypothetical protein